LAQAATQSRTQVGALATLAVAGGGVRVAARDEGARTLQRRAEAPGAHRLARGVDRRGLERPQGVRIVGGAADQRRARLQRGRGATKVRARSSAACRRSSRTGLTR